MNPPSFPGVLENSAIYARICKRDGQLRTQSTRLPIPFLIRTYLTKFSSKTSTPKNSRGGRLCPPAANARKPLWDLSGSLSEGGFAGGASPFPTTDIFSARLSVKRGAWGGAPMEPGGRTRGQGRALRRFKGGERGENRNSPRCFATFAIKSRPVRQDKPI